MLQRTCLIAIALMALCAPALAAQTAQAPRTDETAQPSRMDEMTGMTGGVLANSTTPLLEEDIDAIIANSVPPPLTEPVRVRSGMLSVKLESASFGLTLEEIGRQAGFEAIITPEVASKELSTTFRDMELQKGIQRLLSLISHRNFFIYYGANDSITRIEVYGTGTVQKPGKGRQTYTPSTSPARSRSGRRVVTPSTTFKRPSVSRRTVPAREPARTTPPVTRVSPESRTDNADGDDVEVPYIVPQQEPQYVPPYNRRR
ncbi:MAG: hypothetical protein KAR83_06200 [Thermodesulfovibrionales bacterium]|nr:hypothetical protein [Thermodesulfovibrionales bacterium]